MPVRPLLFVALAVLMLVPSWSGEVRLDLFGRHPVIRAERVALDPADPSRRRVGRLTFMGGVRLTSTDPAFGGYSALAVSGDRITLLSDGGNLVRFRLSRDGAVTKQGFAALPAGPGTGWQKRDRDSEALAMDPATGTIWAAFERANAIWRYRPDMKGATAAVRPAAMRRWPENGGAESLVRRHDGSFVALQEMHGKAAWREGLLWRGDPTAHAAPVRFRYLPPAGYDPADATELPDGRLLVLNRWWGFPFRFANVLVAIDPRALRAGGR